MTARVLIFPRAPAEPPVDPEETLEHALRRHALASLAGFDPELAQQLRDLYQAPDALAHARAVMALWER